MSDICQTCKEQYYKRLVEKGECTTEKQSEKINALYKEKSSVYYCKWIPCSERLPEEPGLYIVTFCAEGKENTVDVDRFYFNGKWWSDMIASIKEKVIAWLQLPEPYQEKVGDE